VEIFFLYIAMSLRRADVIMTSSKMPVLLYLVLVIATVSVCLFVRLSVRLSQGGSVKNGAS